MTDTLHFIIAAAGCAFGASVGSFLAACADRRERGLTPRNPPRSECPKCRLQLRWWENIPLVSYIALGGRCRRCRWRIPPWYFWYEVGFGIAGGAAAFFASSGL